MHNSEQGTRLYIHTLKTLCEELVSGRTVIIDDDGNEFRLHSSEARAIFDWYRKNPSKWAKNVMKQDLEDLADQIEKDPPELPENTYADSSKELPKKIHLKSVRAHRFAGIHRYGQLHQPPEDFYFEFEKPLTMIEGMNGAGKTSLLSAITWCLTGNVYRSQRAPEFVDKPVELEIVPIMDSDSNDMVTHNMTSITPIPSAEILTSLGKEPLPLDTWVETTFIDDDGNEVGTIKRSISRTARGRIVIDEPDFSSLGLDPIAREIGTKMPGLIPYLQLGVASDLGKAVAGLTGIKPLKDLAKHALKSQTKFKKDLVNDRNTEISEADSEFIKVQKELDELIKAHPKIAPKKPLPSPSSDKSIEKDLKELYEHFERLQNKALEEAKLILGDSFNHEDKKASADLIENVGPALGLLDIGNLQRLPSANRLANLAALTSEDLIKAESIIKELVVEAKEIIKIDKTPDVAARLRLYAKVAGWIKELPSQTHNIDSCAICQSVINEKIDTLTGRLITDHIQENLQIDSSYLEKTLKNWEEDTKAKLSQNLPEALRSEMTKILPEKPTDLITMAITEELFESKVFQGSLMPLKELTKTLCAIEFQSLQNFKEPKEIDLPDYFKDSKGGLKQAIGRIIRAIAFARWRHVNGAKCKEAFIKIVGKLTPADKIEISDFSNGHHSLSDCLVALDNMIKGITPLRESFHKIKAMKDSLLIRREKEKRISVYERTAQAIEELISLDDLVERQVAFLIKKLISGTLKWRDDFYIPAFADAPKVVDTDVELDGTIAFNSEVDGTKVSAQHISNSSDLRATLLSFLIAFWQHLMEVRGGLSLLLLDDLHELFDIDNRRRVANTIPIIVENGAKIIITTNDTTFARRVIASSNAKIGAEKIDRRQIHTLNPTRHHIVLGKFIEAIEAKQKTFERPENRNEAQPARDYIKDLRIYIENRLLDFFDIHNSGLPIKPTLSDLISGIRSRMKKNPQEAFASKAFKKLTLDPALSNNSDFINLMNQVHHGNESEISFNAVERVKDECVRIRTLVDNAHEEYERWLRRDPRDPLTSLPACPEPITPPSFNVPVILDLAAFTSETPICDVTESDEYFSDKWFKNHTLYYINTHNFGFAGTPNCRAIVDLSERPIIDKMLVIAMHENKTYARRLFRSHSNQNIVVLGSEAEIPLKRPPTIFLPAEEVRLLNVVGILFDDRPHFPRPSDEALLLDHFDITDNVQLVFKVRGDSAIPLALPGQIILGGKLLKINEIANMKGTPVAISTSEGSFLKKIGESLPGYPYIRQFESIGGLGESILLRTEGIEGPSISLPEIYSIRKILGVLYDSI